MTSSILDNLLAQVAITDHNGVILRTNSSWQSFTNEPAQIKRSEEDTNYYNMLQQAVEMGNDYALKILLGMKKVQRGELEKYSLTYPDNDKNSTSWFKLTFHPLDEDLLEFVMIHEDVTSSMKEEKDREEAKNRYEIQFEQSADGILITDTKGNVLDANPAACKIAGWDKEKLITLTRDDLIDVEDPRYQQALKQRERTGTYKQETSMFHRSGEKIPVEITSHAFRTKNGKLRAVVNFRNISHRKQIESDLLKTKHFTESALNSVPGVFLVLDDKGNIVRWNEHMVTSLGYSPEELTDKNAFEFIVDEEKEKVQAKMNQCIEEGSLSIETKVISKDGSIKDYYLFAKRFVENGKPYLVGTGLDVTEKNKVEKENQRNQLMLQQLFDNAPVGIAIADTEGKVVDINKSFQKIFGYNKSDSIDHDINMLIAPGEKAEEAQKISSLTTQGKNLQIETKRCTKSGKEIPVLIGSVPVQHEDEIIAIYGMYVDVSEQVENQRKIEKTLSEKEALLAELHHRVKNNLALITSMLELQMFETKNSDLEEQLNSVRSRIMTIASIHEVLYQNGSLTKIPLNGFIQELIESQSFNESFNKKNVIIHRDPQDVSLDIKQSIPAGLLLNEILSLIMMHSEPAEKTDLNILIREYGKNVHLIIEGNKLMTCPKEVQNGESLHQILIHTLAQQLDGIFLWPNPDTDYQKFEFIFTKQKNGVSPAADLLEVAE
ncbi:MAG: PAS domain S-box protein [Balneolaceae bacterium]|nr:PAS domain S-box protein [Balneolaceae bacterium]